jgi:uncharacterized protein YpbB
MTEKVLSRFEEIILCCYVALEELERKGYVSVEHKNFSVEQSGRDYVKKMESEGREPTQDEINLAMSELVRDGICKFKRAK